MHTYSVSTGFVIFTFLCFTSVTHLSFEVSSPVFIGSCSSMSNTTQHSTGNSKYLKLYSRKKFLGSYTIIELFHARNFLICTILPTFTQKPIQFRPLTILQNLPKYDYFSLLVPILQERTRINICIPFQSRKFIIFQLVGALNNKLTAR